jgi:hypothetical protein
LQICFVVVADNIGRSEAYREPTTFSLFRVETAARVAAFFKGMLPRATTSYRTRV